jgi:iron complex transport system permease protein
MGMTRPGALPAGLLLLAAAIAAAILLGPARVSPQGLVAVLADALALAPLPDQYLRDAAILTAIRLPRALVAAIVGGGLGIAGAAMQGLFRNPLADPGLIGVSAGAALAAVSAIVLGGELMRPAALLRAGTLALWLLPAASFAGGLAATLLVARIAARDGGMPVGMLLLAGIAINALANAGIGLLLFMADDRQIRDVNFWLLGSLSGARWPMLPVLVAMVLVPATVLLAMARPLNALALGEREAFHLGIDVERAKRIAIVLAAITVSAGVAFTGLIGFVGLVVPHLVRLACGADHRVVLPGSALLGGALLSGADLAARTLAAPAELPIGVVTSLIGAPFFLWLMRRALP